MASNKIDRRTAVSVATLVMLDRIMSCNPSKRHWKAVTTLRFYMRKLSDYIG